MPDSRRIILDRLGRTARPFPGAQEPPTYLPMVLHEDVSAEGLEKRFIAMAERAGCRLYYPRSQDEALSQVCELCAGESAVSCWDPAFIPVPGLVDALRAAGIQCVGLDDAVGVGLTGVDAALAATGSLVIKSGPGRLRTASLLPERHVAIVARSQILADLESWWALERVAGLDQMRRSSNIVVITGPSRSADIAMQLIFGMHGPREVHIVLVK